jgi:vacuolar protein sorting-associated protein 13A/C
VVVEGSSALDQDDFARVTMVNKLGTTIFVQAVDTNYSSTQTLPAGECAVVRLPPPRFPELYTAGFTCQDENRPQRRFMAVRLLDGVDLPSGAGVCDLEYMCVLRVQTTLHNRKGRDAKVLPQSARTRCVRPSSEEDGHNVVRWEEVFLFEIPIAGKSAVELTVLSQAANAGQGEPVGVAVVFMSSAKDVEEGKWNLIREHIDIWKGMNWPDVEVQSAPLYVLGDHERALVGGHVDFAQTFFKYSSSGDEVDGLLQRSVQLGLSSDGPWTGLRSVLALATYPERLGDTHFAVDVVLKQGLKFVELRSLVVLTNELDCPLEVCICPRALLDQVDVAGDSPADGLAVVVEEQFENQRYQPIRGWGSKWPGNFVLGDPARWSTGDGLQSSQVRLSCTTCVDSLRALVAGIEPFPEALMVLSLCTPRKYKLCQLVKANILPGGLRIGNSPSCKLLFVRRLVNRACESSVMKASILES